MGVDVGLRRHVVVWLIAKRSNIFQVANVSICVRVLQKFAILPLLVSPARLCGLQMERTVLKRTIRWFLWLQMTSALIVPDHLLYHVYFKVRTVQMGWLCEHYLILCLDWLLRAVASLPLLVRYVLRLLLLDWGVFRIGVVDLARVRLLGQHLVEPGPPFSSIS